MNDEVPTTGRYSSGWRAVRAALSAAFGVQSRRGWHRDASSGRAWQFVVAGLLVLALLIAVLAGVVRAVLAAT